MAQHISGTMCYEVERKRLENMEIMEMYAQSCDTMRMGAIK